MTFSIVARDAHTGMLGVAVTTKFFGVGSLCPFARAGVGDPLRAEGPILRADRRLLYRRTNLRGGQNLRPLEIDGWGLKWLPRKTGA